MSNHHRSGNAEESLEAALRQSVRKMQETEAMRVIRERSRKVAPPQAPSVNPFKEAPYITKARQGLEALFNLEG
jgi:hypothetical protein